MIARPHHNLQDGRRGAVAAVCLALLALCCFGGCRKAERRLESEPPGASVWSGEELLGTTPMTLPAVGGKVVLRLSLPGCIDQVIEVDSGEAPADGVWRVALTPPDRGRVRCESEPDSADVFVDGEFRGRTPLELRDLEPRAYEVSFMLAGRKTVTQALDLSAGQAPPVLRVQLPSLTEEYYRQQLEREPGNLHHYCDLAHHYILEHRFDEAMAVFDRAVRQAIENPGIDNKERLWSEMDRVVEEQYDYGDEAAVDRARRALAKTLEALHTAYPEAPFPPLHVTYVMVLDSIDQRQRAQEAYERACRRFPLDQGLRRLRRLGFAAP